MHHCQAVFALLILWQARLSKKELQIVGWRHLSLQPCVSIKSPGLPRGLFLPLFSISVFYLDLKWGLVNILSCHSTPLFGSEKCFMRFHKRDLCSQGRWYGSVQGGITIFSHAGCLEMQKGGAEGTERQRSAQKSAFFKVKGQTLYLNSVYITVFFTDCVVIMRNQKKLTNLFQLLVKNCELFYFYEFFLIWLKPNLH